MRRCLRTRLLAPGSYRLLIRERPPRRAQDEKGAQEEPETKPQGSGSLLRANQDPNRMRALGSRCGNSLPGAIPRCELPGSTSALLHTAHTVATSPTGFEAAEPS